MIEFIVVNCHVFVLIRVMPHLVAWTSDARFQHEFQRAVFRKHLRNVLELVYLHNLCTHTIGCECVPVVDMMRPTRIFIV
jgi:hypothetical protein